MIGLSAAGLFLTAARFFGLLGFGAVAASAGAGGTALASTSSGTAAGGGLGFSLAAFADITALARVTTFAGLSRVHFRKGREKVFEELITKLLI